MIDINTRNSAKENFTLAQQFAAFSEDLRNIYFFTEEQIRNVFLKTKTHDINIFNQIVADVEKQYTISPMEMPISDYLYKNLMSIEDITQEVIDQQKYREILNHPEKYIEVDISHVLQYGDFKKSYNADDDLVHNTIINYIQKHVQEIYLLHIEEELLSQKDIKKLPKRIQNRLRFSEYRGINLYTFVQKNWEVKIAPWVFGWSMWRANDSYFGEVFNEYKAPVVRIALSSLTSLV